MAMEVELVATGEGRGIVFHKHILFIIFYFYFVSFVAQDDSNDGTETAENRFQNPAVYTPQTPAPTAIW